MKTLLIISTLLIATSLSAGTRDNDDTCDIKVGPAATLLLPYFEVDVTNPAGQTTLFTITNVTRYPQIAHVTLWTDLAYPVLDFNLFLTGYDIQSINLYDVLVNGVIAPPAGTTSATTPGSLSAPNTANGNLDPATLPCAGLANVPLSLRIAVKDGLTTGVFNPGGGITGCSTVGSVHANAIGYATIDVVTHCTSRLPIDPLYYTTDLLFDNVLIGDYQQLGARPAGTGVSPFEAGGNPMVHIRAVPEGGGAGSIVATGLPYTFYDRYTPATNRTVDRRQPLPSAFAARYIQGGPNAFATNVSIWREGVTGPGASCAAYSNNSYIPISEFVRFDEHENPSVLFSLVDPFPGPPLLPATSSSNTARPIFPPLIGVDVAGWMYLNLDNGGSPRYSVTTNGGSAPAIVTGPTNTAFGRPRASQNWVTVTMFGHLGTNRLATEFDAASLGNGCSAAEVISPADGGTRPIGPAGGVFVCPPGTTLTNGTTTQCTGTNINPP